MASQSRASRRGGEAVKTPGKRQGRGTGTVLAVARLWDTAAHRIGRSRAPRPSPRLARAVLSHPGFPPTTRLSPFPAWGRCAAVASSGKPSRRLPEHLTYGSFLSVCQWVGRLASVSEAHRPRQPGSFPSRGLGTGHLGGHLWTLALAVRRLFSVTWCGTGGADGVNPGRRAEGGCSAGERGDACPTDAGLERGQGPGSWRDTTREPCDLSPGPWGPMKGF